jgi:hypothetical protein
MITSVEFDAAVQLIVDYKLQLNKQLEIVVAVRNKKINIRKDIGEKAIKALQIYYELHYRVRLQLEDLNAMDRQLLASIDYDKMLLIKGFGRTAIFNFKKVMILHSVLDQKDL